MKSVTLVFVLLMSAMLILGCTVTKQVQNQTNGNPASNPAGAGQTGGPAQATNNQAGNMGGTSTNGPASAGASDATDATGANATVTPGGNNGTLYANDQNPLFFWGGWGNPDYTIPYYATAGMPYNYSFCEPSMSGPNDLCGASNGTTTPSGGDGPYHFQLDSGIGFPPQGLILHPNGYMDGTPSIAGTSTFGVCAVDTAGRAVCDDNLTMTVVNPVTLTVSKSGSGDGMLQTGTDTAWNDCGDPCTAKFHSPYYYSGDTSSINISAQAGINAVPANGSVFDHWEGDACGENSTSYANGFASTWSGNGTCEDITMDRDRSVTAVFTKLSVTMDTHNCPVYDEFYWGGTAGGPVGIGVYVTSPDENSETYGIDDVQCGTWTKGGNEDYLCTRRAGQPETTTWSMHATNNGRYAAKTWMATLGEGGGVMAQTPGYVITCPPGHSSWDTGST